MLTNRCIEVLSDVRLKTENTVNFLLNIAVPNVIAEIVVTTIVLITVGKSLDIFVDFCLTI